MTNADAVPVDIDEMREFLLAEKAKRKASWPTIGQLIGAHGGTLSVFAGGHYQGDNEGIARKIFKWRQTFAAQEARIEGLATHPGYFETESSKRIYGLLTIAQTGRITVVAASPGIGKTETATEYAAHASNVWIATMRKTTRTLNAMMGAVAKSIGLTRPNGYGAPLSNSIVERLRGTRGLLIIDEAQHLCLEAIEEVRAWHDEIGIGICLLGHAELLSVFKGGPKHRDYAQLTSRFGGTHEQIMPLAEDVTIFCDAWGLEDSAIRGFLSKVALTPGAGGLRECRMIVEQASMIAIDEGRTMSVHDLRDVQRNRATRFIRA